MDKEITNIIKNLHEKYNYVGNYIVENLRVVYLNDKWGFVNEKGEEVIPCKYDYVFDFNEGLAIIKLNNKWGFIDINNLNEFMNYIFNIGSRLDTLYYQRYKDTYILTTGCFIGTLNQFKDAVESCHSENSKPYNDYMKVIKELNEKLVV